MNRMSLKYNWLKFKTAGKLLIILEEFKEYIPNLMKENRTMSTCKRLDLQTLGSQPIMPENLPNHCNYVMLSLPAHACEGHTFIKTSTHYNYFGNPLSFTTVPLPIPNYTTSAREVSYWAGIYSR